MQAQAAAPYDARSGYHDVDTARYERRRYRGLRQRLNLRLLERALVRALEGVGRERPILDLPCGTGILAARLTARGWRVVASDISPAMLAHARGRSGAIGHVRADLERPPYRPGAFGAVVCARFLMHLPAAVRPAVLRTLAELTDGPLVATVCHPYTLKSGTRALRRFLHMRSKRSPRLTRDALDAEVRAAGLRVERVVRLVPLVSEVWVAVISHPSRPAP
jgi:SAM-dependent methyltransferase